jgi:cytoskeletal protein RodZ
MREMKGFGNGATIQHAYHDSPVDTILYIAQRQLHVLLSWEVLMIADQHPQRSIVRQKTRRSGRTNSMKARNFFLAAAMGMFACAPASVLAQSVGQDMKNAGHDTADASKKVANKTATGTKTAVKDTGHGTKVAADKTAAGTKTVAHDTAHGTSVAAHKTEQGTKTVAHDTAHGTEVAAHKTGDAGKTVGRDTVHGTKKAVHTIDGKPESDTNQPR